MADEEILHISIEQDENGWLTVESKQIPELLIFTDETIDELLESLPEKIKALLEGRRLSSSTEESKKHLPLTRILAQVQYNYPH